MSTTTAVAAPVLGVDEFKKVLPEKMRKSITPEVMKLVNDMLADPDMGDAYRDNLLGYTSVINEGKFKIGQYVHAVKYVSYKIMGKSNIDAFTATFPDKMARWNQQGVASNNIASYITSYNKNKLVNLILAQTLIPTHILNADKYQLAINVQVDLMQNAQSEKVRCEAANSLLTHLKAPDQSKLQLGESAQTADSISALRKSVAELVELQRAAIDSGVLNARDVAERRMLFEQSDAEDGVIVQ